MEATKFSSNFNIMLTRLDVMWLQCYVVVEYGFKKVEANAVVVLDDHDKLPSVKEYT